MKRPKKTNDPEEFFFETIRIAQASATAHEKAKFITVYAPQPWRSAVVTAFVTCPENIAHEIATAFDQAVDSVFSRHGESVPPNKMH